MCMYVHVPAGSMYLHVLLEAHALYVPALCARTCVCTMYMYIPAGSTYMYIVAAKPTHASLGFAANLFEVTQRAHTCSIYTVLY